MNIKPQQMEMFAASHLAESLGGKQQWLDYSLIAMHCLETVEKSQD